MKRVLVRIRAAAALLMTAWLGAAPSPSPVADAAMKATARPSARCSSRAPTSSAARGDGMTALHFAAERGDAAMAEMLVYAGANVARRHAHRPVHAAPHRQPRRQRRGRPGAAEGRRQTSRPSDDDRAASRRCTSRPRPAAWRSSTLLLDHGADANAKESEWGQTPLMFAAADNRVGAIRLLLARGADATIKTKTIDIAHQSALDRAANELAEEGARGSVPKGQTPTPTQVQAAIEASRELFASGKIPPPEEAPAGGRGGRGGRRPAIDAANAGRTASTPKRSTRLGVEQGRA